MDKNLICRAGGMIDCDEIFASRIQIAESDAASLREVG